VAWLRVCARARIASGHAEDAARGVWCVDLLRPEGLPDQSSSSPGLPAVRPFASAGKARGAFPRRRGQFWYYGLTKTSRREWLGAHLASNMSQSQGGETKRQAQKRKERELVSKFDSVERKARGACACPPLAFCQRSIRHACSPLRFAPSISKRAERAPRA
jgi:hypothetical protein